MKHYIKTLFWYIPKLAKEFSGNSSLNCLILTFNFWAFVLTRKTILRGVPKTFKFEYKSKIFTLKSYTAIDIAVLAEVFVLKEYEWRLDHKVDNILDLGSHWGDSSIYYAMEYPQATIFAVEPTPDAFNRLTELSKQFPNITPIKGALSDKAGEQTLFVSDSTLGNSFIKRSTNGGEISVSTFDFNSLKNIMGVKMVDLVKFDIEGAEKYLFADSSIKNYVKSFIGEIHLDLMDVSLEDVHEYFSDFKLDLFKLSESRYIIKATR